MKIIVGSHNVPKRNAVERAFRAAFPDEQITVESVDADSGVSSHPTSSEESINGAMARVAHAKELAAGADYYVGIEGRLLTTAGKTWEIGWVVISDAHGKIATGLSSGIEIQGKILRAITSGVELNDVLQNDYDITSAGNTNGYYGLATNDLVTRQAAYEQGITFALAPFLHPEFYMD
ncbi:MAG: DUF84 family protein [Candidatus Saccharibacteria bacterium]